MNPAKQYRVYTTEIGIPFAENEKLSANCAATLEFYRRDENHHTFFAKDYPESLRVVLTPLEGTPEEILTKGKQNLINILAMSISNETGEKFEEVLEKLIKL